MAISLFEPLPYGERMSLLNWLNMPECQMMRDQLQLLALKKWNDTMDELHKTSDADFNELKREIEMLEKLSEMMLDMSTDQFQFVKLKKP